MAENGNSEKKGERGAFIVFEGCDRSGKSTVSRRIVEHLNTQAEVIVFPDRSTSIGKVIDSYLKKEIELPDRAIHLLFVANRWERAEYIKSKIENGITVIADRYSYSGIVYSAAKNMDDCNFKWFKPLEEGLPKPDAVFFLTLSQEVIGQRKGFGNERYELPQFQKNVSECYEKLNDGSWTIIDADKTIEDLTAEVLALVKNVMKESKEKPLGQLW